MLLFRDILFLEITLNHESFLSPVLKNKQKSGKKCIIIFHHITGKSNRARTVFCGRKNLKESNALIFRQYGEGMYDRECTNSVFFSIFHFGFSVRQWIKSSQISKICQTHVSGKHSLKPAGCSWRSYQNFHQGFLGAGSSGSAIFFLCLTTCRMGYFSTIPLIRSLRIFPFSGFTIDT